MADITRDSFDESLLIQKKIFQKNRYVMDDELNVLQDILNIRLRRVLSELVEQTDGRFGSGFTVLGDANPNTVVVHRGACAIHVDTHHTPLLWFDANQTVDGWTTPSGSDRTDYLYLDIYEDEIDSTEDPNLINPARGEETTRDLRLVWTFEKSEGSTPGSPPTDHTYISIARIERSDGVAVIQTSDITNLLDDYHDAYLKRDGTKSLTGNLSVDSGVTVDGINLSAHREPIYCMNTEAAREVNDSEADEYDASYANCFVALLDTTNPTQQKKVIADYYKHPNINKIYCRYEVQNSGTGATRGLWGLRVNGTFVEETTEGISSWGTFVTIAVDISAIGDGTYLAIDLEANRHGSNVTIYARKVDIWASFD